MTTASDQHVFIDQTLHSSGNRSAVIPCSNSTSTPQRLTRDYLRQLDQNHEATDPMTLWLQERDRTAPWNALAYVGIEQGQYKT